MRRMLIKFLSGIYLITVLSQSIVFGQNKRICGIVKDSISREVLVGATVFLDYSNGCITDENGYFCLQYNSETDEYIKIRFIGFKEKTLLIPQNQDTLLSVLLMPGIDLKEIKITGQFKSVRDLGTAQIPVSYILSVPSLAGEPDIMKTFQLLPGIKMGDEGSSGMYVRGGTPDQNLYLLDDIPLYYINHLGGFVSIFDISSINDIKLYKSDIPARYGGRLSSVMDIRLKDGNQSFHKHEISIGTLVSRLFSEGMLFNEKTSYILSLRRSNVDLFMRPFTYLGSGGKEVYSYVFYDITGKVVYQFSDKNKFSILFYRGNDKLSFKERYTSGNNDLADYVTKDKIIWGNQSGSVKWNYIIKNNLHLESQLYLTDFKYKLTDEFEVNSETSSSEFYGELSSGIKDIALQNGIKFIGKHYNLQTGLNIVYHEFSPVSKIFKLKSSDASDERSFSENIYQPEFTGYIDNEILLGKINLAAGFYSMIWPGISGIKVDPRVAIGIQIMQNSKVKFSYSITHQFIHLLTTNGSGIPSDIWVPSTSVIEPEKSMHFSVGGFHEVSGYEFSVEVYFKKMDGLIMYKPGSNLISINDWQESIETGGSGFSRGVELLIKKTQGKNTGWIGYSLSKNERQFSGINNGEKFPFKYDQRHEIDLSLNHKFNDRIEFSSSWVFTTGNALTIATKTYPAIDVDYFSRSAEGNDPFFREANFYDGINNYRAKPYHRLDIGFRFTKDKKHYTRVFYTGIYNLYNRKNPYYYFFTTRNDHKKFHQFTLFPMLPTISYTLKF